MSTMMYGFHYNRGKRIGYDISFNGFIISFVSSKDKARIVREIKERGYSKNDITIERRED